MTRDVAELAAGLDPIRDPRAVVAGERIHVVGAAGAGASAAALLASGAGAIVTGCDAGGPSPYSEALMRAGIAVAWRHDASHVTGPDRPDRLAVTKALTAVQPDHPELRAARDAGIPIEPWQQLVADTAVGRTLVAVAGTHGKSTTAGWLVHVLVEAGLDPAAFVGALLPPALTGGIASTARPGGPDGPFVVEADEYAGNFDAYLPDLVVLTSVDWDHPDVFADQAATEAAFTSWLARPRNGRRLVLVANVADAGVARVVAALDASPVGAGDRRVRLVGTALLGETDDAVPTSPDVAIAARIVAAEPEATIVDLHGLDAAGPLRVRLRSAGRHNVANALGVAAAAHELGVPPGAIVDGLERFAGVGRRLERRGEAAGVVIYDDYGHHPTAIRATVAAVRQRQPGRRLWAVYEPLTFHRTAAMLPGFAAALAEADAVVIADIWAGRDPDTTIASADGLAAAVRVIRPDIPVVAPGSIDATADWLAGHVRPGDAVLVMGGGRSYRIASGLLERLGGGEARP
jgi:UDP-N-acetylmuramate--alanine ligase